jgi:RNA polymerase sigma factor for flagellar operon FliA
MQTAALPSDPIAACRDLIARAARRTAARHRWLALHVDIDDYAQAASLAALLAAQRFEPERGIPFRAFARDAIFFAAEREAIAADPLTARSRRILRGAQAAGAALDPQTKIGRRIANELGARYRAQLDAPIDPNMPDGPSLACTLASDDDTAVAALRAFDRDEIERAIAKLPFLNAYIVRRVYLDDMPLRGVADELGLSERTAETRRYRGLRRLRALLAAGAVDVGGPT